MTEILTKALAIFGGGAVVIAALVGAAYWLFKLFSERWLNARFNERLEDYKHRQQRELEELRFKINSLMDRTTKLSQREFEVLPEVWGKLVTAHGYVVSVTSAFQSYADLDRMTPDQLTEFLEKCPLANWEKEQIKRELKKSDYYIKAINWHKVSEARSKNRDFFVYLRKNGIFIRDDIKTDFDAFADFMHQVLVEQEIHLEHPNYGPDSRKARDKFNKESDGILKDLERKVQGRLWDSQQTNSAS